ncbi:MAG: lipocalin-like domain-containing protein [Terriglobia bacterium]
MRFCLAAVLLLASSPLRYRMAMPGYRFQFPRDNFNHPQYQTEWWYYTGNLRARDGRQFGFELTFFRLGISQRKTRDSTWAVNTIYMAHMAVSDLTGHRFYYQERFNRAGPGLAGIDPARALVWNGNWSAQWSGNQQRLQAMTASHAFDLTLTSLKSPVINGQNGLSLKGPAMGEASHYISLTRIKTAGTMRIHDRTFRVLGVSWMDHEFFTETPDPALTGWDWFSVQLDNDTELMLYRLRLKDGRPSPYSSGTYVDAQGHSYFLSARDFNVTPGATWSSPRTHARYPVQWRISVPPRHIDLLLTTPLSDQELVGRPPLSPTYWEGAVRLNGQAAGKKVQGVGYLEMTGYAAPLNANPGKVYASSGHSRQHQ